MEEKEDIKDKIISEFNLHSDKNNYWKEMGELSELVGYSPSLVERVLENSEPDSFFGTFIQNSEGCWTTRDLYKKYTPFLTKLRHGYQLYID